MGATNYDKLKQKFLARQQRAAEVDDRWWKAEMGRHKIRVLPPPDGYDIWFMEYGVHYGLQDAEGNYQTVTCARATAKKPCPICEFTKGLWKSGKQGDEAIARKYGCKKRFVSNIAVFGSSGPEVKLWSYGSTVMDQLEEHCMAADGSIVPIDDPVKGMNMKLVVSQKSTPEGNFPQYLITPEVPAAPLQDKSLLAKTVNFVDLVTSKLRPYEEVRALLYGASPEAAASGPSESVVVEEPVGVAGEEVVVHEPAMKETTNASQEASRPAPEDLVRRAREALAKQRSK